MRTVRIISVMLLSMFQLIGFSCSVLAADGQGAKPLDIAAIVEHQEMAFKEDLDASSTGYGAYLGYTVPFGLTLDAALTHENLKVHDRILELDFKGSGLALALGLSQRLYQNDVGTQINIGGRGKFYFFKAGQDIIEIDGFVLPANDFPEFVDPTFQQRIELSKLSIYEAKLEVAQKLKQFELSAALLSQWAKADLDLVERDLFFDEEERFNLLKAKEKSNLGGNIGAKILLGDTLYVAANATIIDKISYSALFGGRF